MRLMPGNGFSLENLGCRDLPLKIKPPSITGEINATRTTPVINGNSAIIASLISRMIWLRIRFGSLTILWSKRNPADSIPASLRASDSPPIQIMHTPTSKISSEVSSLDRGTCPSSRAFSSRWGVGASVLSSSLSSATHQTLDRDIGENDARTAIQQWEE